MRAGLLTLGILALIFGILIIPTLSTDAIKEKTDKANEVDFDTSLGRSVEFWGKVKSVENIDLSLGTGLLELKCVQIRGTPEGIWVYVDKSLEVDDEVLVEGYLWDILGYGVIIGEDPKGLSVGLLTLEPPDEAEVTKLPVIWDTILLFLIIIGIILIIVGIVVPAKKKTSGKKYAQYPQNQKSQYPYYHPYQYQQPYSHPYPQKRAQEHKQITPKIDEEIECPSCKVKNDKDSRFCIGCGFYLGKIKCLSCGLENKPGSKFCKKCGNEITIPINKKDDEIKNPCKTCGKELKFIKDHSRWYCYSCEKYI